MFALDCASPIVITAISVAGYDSESVVGAAMRVKIPQICERGQPLVTGPPFFAIRRQVENDAPKTCTACGPWWRLPLLLGFVLAAIVWSRVHGLLDESPVKNISQPAPAASGVPQEKV